MDVKQTSLDLVSSHALKPDLCLLARTPIPEAVDRISAAVKGVYPGVDATILATDASAGIRFAADITSKHGTLVLLGQPKDGVTLTARDLIYRDLRLVASILGDRETAQELTGLVVDKGVEVDTKLWRVEEAEVMRLEYVSGKSEGKNVIVFGDSTE